MPTLEIQSFSRVTNLKGEVVLDADRVGRGHAHGAHVEDDNRVPLALHRAGPHHILGLKNRIIDVGMFMYFTTDRGTTKVVHRMYLGRT